MAKGVIAGGKKVSVRKAPWDPLNDEVIKELALGETVVVDSLRPCYDWKGHMFYPLMDGGYQNGYVRAEAVRFYQKVTLNRRE